MPNLVDENPFYEPYKNPIIEKTNCSDGNYVIRVSPATRYAFWKKKDAQAWLNRYLESA